MQGLTDDVVGTIVPLKFLEVPPPSNRSLIVGSLGRFVLREAGGAAGWRDGFQRSRGGRGGGKAFCWIQRGDRFHRIGIAGS